MRINMTSTLVPLLKSKVDELFLKWLSTDETQKCLQEDLSRILHGVSPAAFETPVISSVVSARPASPPAPPNATLNTRSPTRSPKPTRKLNKSHNKSNDCPLASLDVSDGPTSAIPRFYFPKGTPSHNTNKINEKISRKVENIFKINQRIPVKEFSSVTKVGHYVKKINLCTLLDALEYHQFSIYLLQVLYPDPRLHPMHPLLEMSNMD